jgi:raffinose/stachyose/melibiose transport system permease protein
VIGSSNGAIGRSAGDPTRRQLIWGRRRRWLKNSLVAWLFMLPAVVLYAVFVLRPAVDVFGLSAYEWDGISRVRDWVGLDNFVRLLTDPVFWQAFRNNLIWLVLIVTFNVLVGLVAASLLSTAIRARFVFRLGYFLPVIQASIVTAMIWRWIYSPDGLLNTTLKNVGLGWLARGWLGDLTFALPALAVAACWAGFGLSVVIFLAGMQGVDQSLYDAARVDGASSRQLFRYVTIPSLRNTITVVVLLQMIAAFQVFDIIWATTQGGPIRETEMLATYMFKRGFQQGEFGQGAAIAVVLCGIVLAFSAVYLLIQERGND